MPKMRLEPETLTVESFSTAGMAKQRGTVRAHSAYPECLYEVTYQPESCGDWCGYPTARNCGGGTGTTTLPPVTPWCSVDPCYPIETPP